MQNPRFRFFHDQLPDEYSRGFYDALEEGIGRRAASITYRRGPEGFNYLEVLEHVYNDHPDFFALDPFNINLSTLPAQVILRPIYRYPEADCQAYDRLLQKTAGDIMARLFPEGAGTLSEIEREKRIFDWIVDHVVYDHRSLDRLDSGLDVKESLAWNAYGALVLRNAVCAGIACGFKLLCDMAGLPCIVVNGKAGSGRHAWNIVRIQQRFYQVDCTWDLKSTLGREIPYARYCFFNLPDEIMGITHTPECRFLPRCGSLRYNPFHMRGYCAERMEELVPLAQAQIEAGKTRFAFMCLNFKADGRLCAAVRQILLSKMKLPIRIITYYTNTGTFIGFVVER